MVHHHFPPKKDDATNLLPYFFPMSTSFPTNPPVRPQKRSPKRAAQTHELEEQQGAPCPRGTIKLRGFVDLQLRLLGKNMGRLEHGE
jgi:hypothetical protein